MSLQQTTNHIERALDRLLSQYREKPNLAGWMSAFTAEVQEIEDAFFGLLLQRFLSNAVGEQLNIIGRRVGLERKGLDDVRYRVFLRAWIRANRSSGTGDDVLEVADLALQGADITFIPSYPAAFVLEVTEALGEDALTIASLISRARLAGVNGQLLYNEVAAAATFTTASGDAEESSTTQGTASGDSDTTGTGGLLADVMET